MQHVKKSEQESKYTSSNTSRAEIKTIDMAKGKQIKKEVVINLTSFKPEDQRRKVATDGGGINDTDEFNGLKAKDLNRSCVVVSNVAPRRVHFKTNSTDITNLINHKITISPIKRYNPLDVSELSSERDKIQIIPTEKCIDNPMMPVMRKDSEWFNSAKPEGYLNVRTSRIYEIPQTKVADASMRRLSQIMLKGGAKEELPKQKQEGSFISYNKSNFSSSPSKKFLKMTLAVMQGRGPNCEYRSITRATRGEKGGVIDFGTKNFSSEQKVYNVKKFNASKRTTNNCPITSIKQRDLAVKIIQQWWRDILNSCRSLVYNVTKIQSIFRGRLVRNNLLAQLEMKQLEELLNTNLKLTIVKGMRQFVFGNLIEAFGEKYQSRKMNEGASKIQKSFKRRRMLKRNVTGGVEQLKISLTKHNAPHFINQLARNRTEQINTFYDSRLTPAMRKLKHFSQRRGLNKFLHQSRKFKHIPVMFTNFINQKEKDDNIRMKDTLSHLKNQSNKMARREKLLKLFSFFIKEKLTNKIKSIFAHLKAYDEVRNVLIKNFNFNSACLNLRGKVLKTNPDIFDKISKHRSLTWYANELPKLIKTISNPSNKNSLNLLKNKKLQHDRIKKCFNSFPHRMQNKNIGRTFNRWKGLSQTKPKMLIRVAEGFNALGDIIPKYKLTFLSSLKDSTGKNKLRNRIIGRVIGRNGKNIQNFFDRWKVLLLKDKLADTKEKYKSRLFQTPTVKLLQKQRALSLDGAFSYWKEMSLIQNAEEKSKIANGLTKLSKVLHLNDIKKPFVRIKTSKNIKKFCDRLQPVVSNSKLKNAKSFIEGVKETAQRKDKQNVGVNIIKRIERRLKATRPIRDKFNFWKKMVKEVPKRIEGGLGKLKNGLMRHICVKTIIPALQVGDFGIKKKIPMKLKSIVRTQNRKQDHQNGDNLRKYFTNWRSSNNIIKSALLALATFTTANDKLNKNNFFHRLKIKDFKLNVLKPKLNKIINKIHPREHFKKWRQMTGRNLKNMFNDYLNSNSMKKNQFTVPTKEIGKIVQICANGRQRSANKIISFVSNSNKKKIQNVKSQRTSHSLTKMINLNDIKFKILLKICLNKWKAKAKELQLHKSARVLQSHLRKRPPTSNANPNNQDSLLKFHQRSHLVGILADLANDNQTILKQFFLRWKKHCELTKMNTAARTMQRFFHYAVMKKSSLNLDLNILKQFKGLNLLNRSFTSRIMKYPFDKIVQEARRRVLIKFVHFLRKKKSDLFKQAFQQLINFETTKTYVTTKCVEKIQSVFRMRCNKKGVKRLLLKMRKIRTLTQNALTKNEKIKDSMFKRWKRMSMFLQWKGNAEKIQNFIRGGKEKKNKIKIIEATSQLRNIFNDGAKIQRTKALKDFIAHYTINKGTKMLRKHIFTLFQSRVNTKHKGVLLKNIISLIEKSKLNSKKTAMMKMLTNNHKTNQTKKLKNILQNKIYTEENLIHREYFSRWSQLIGYFKSIRPQIERKIIKTIQQAQRRENLFKGFSCLKLTKLNAHLIQFRKRRALNKIKIKSQNIETIKHFGAQLTKLEGSHTDSTIKSACDKIYQLYVYKILSKYLFSVLDNKISHVTYQKRFFNNLYDYDYHNSKCTGKITHDYTVINNRNTKQPYSNQTSKNEMNILQSVQSNKRMSPYVYITPHLVKILSKDFTSRFENFTQNLKLFHKGLVLYSKLQMICRKLSNNGEIFLHLRNSLPMIEKQNSYAKFVKLVRKQTLVNSVLKYLKNTSRLFKLMQLIKLTLYHRHVEQVNYTRMIFKKLSLFARMKIISKKKMGQVYKNMNINLLIEPQETSYEPLTVRDFDDESYLKYFK